MGSERAVIQFITAMRAHDPAAVAANAVGDDHTLGAQLLVKNYADLLKGPITVTFDLEGTEQGRTTCLSFPSYPYQLYLFVVKGNNGKDSAHWKASLGDIQGPPPTIKPGRPTPPPHNDKDAFCEDGFNVDPPPTPVPSR